MVGFFPFEHSFGQRKAQKCHQRGERRIRAAPTRDMEHRRRETEPDAGLAREKKGESPQKYKTCSGGAAWSPALPPAHLLQQGRVCRAPERAWSSQELWFGSICSVDFQNSILALFSNNPELLHPDPAFQQHHLEPGPALGH